MKEQARLKVIKHYYMAWLNSNVECGLLFLDIRPLRSTSGARILIVGGPPENWMGQLK